MFFSRAEKRWRREREREDQPVSPKGCKAKPSKSNRVVKQLFNTSLKYQNVSRPSFDKRIPPLVSHALTTINYMREHDYDYEGMGIIIIRSHTRPCHIYIKISKKTRTPHENKVSIH